MQLVESWRTVVLDNYANFSGRARRAEYWWFVLANLTVYIVLSILADILARVADIFSVLPIVYYLAVLVPSIAVGVRRLHDIGKPGVWLLLAFIPLIGGIILFVWFARDSDRDMNTYGPSPKYATG